MNKKLILAGLVVTSAIGCVGNGGDAPVQVLGSYSVDESCTLQTEIQSIGASYDLAGVRTLGSTAASFAAVMVTWQLKSELSSARTSANGQTLSDESRNGVYIDQVQLSYRSTPNLTFESESYPMSAFIAAGGTLNGVTDVLGTKAAQKLLDSVTPGGEVYEVIANVRFRGYTAGSTGSTFTTNDVEFPINVYDLGPLTCPSGPAFDGPCGAVSGQASLRGGSARCAAGDGGVP